MTPAHVRGIEYRLAPEVARLGRARCVRVRPAVRELRERDPRRRPVIVHRSAERHAAWVRGEHDDLT